MSYIYHSDYTTSDYWDPILYPRNNVYSSLLYNKIDKCVNKQKKYVARDKEYSDSDEKIYFCDLTPTINAYNNFMKEFTVVYNLIMEEYNRILRSIIDMKTNDVVADDWIESIRPFHEGHKKFSPINFVPIDIDVSHLIVCEAIFDIIETIQKDVNERTLLIKTISKFDTINPTELWNRIYAS